MPAYDDDYFPVNDDFYYDDDGVPLDNDLLYGDGDDSDFEPFEDEKPWEDDLSVYGEDV